MKINKLILIFSLLISSCASHYKSSDSIQIYETSNKDIVLGALNIVIDEFIKEGLYTKKQINNVLYKYKFNNHINCSSPEHKLTIIFRLGDYYKKKRCIFSRSNHLKGKCLYGMFDGQHTISMIDREKIYNTSFAHELLHYFQKYIDGMPPSIHVPEIIWKNLLGYNVKDNIGTVNEALKKKGL